MLKAALGQAKVLEVVVGDVTSSYDWCAYSPISLHVDHCTEYVYLEGRLSLAAQRAVEECAARTRATLIIAS
jgi:hypothetical protein